MRTLMKLSKIFLILGFLVGLTFSESKALEKREIQIYTNPPGSTAHAIAWGFCDMLSKHSSWLRGTVEVAWGVDFIKLLNKDPSRKKSGAGNMVPANLWEAKRVGIKDINVLVILKTMTTNQFWVTFDPKIKSVLDFVGKRVSIGKAGTALAVGPENIFKELGIYDKIKIQYMDFNDSKTAFFDRTVDVAWASGVLGKDKGMPVPASMEIALSGKPFYCIGVEQKWIDAVRTKMNYPISSILMPKFIMGKNQPEAVLTIEYDSSWLAYPEFDSDSAYEMCRVMWDHIEELAKYHKAGALLTREDLPNTSFPSNMFHPGAIKFYKEKGVKIGRD